MLREIDPMKVKWLLLVLLLAAFPALAQDTATTSSVNTVAFNGFSFSLPSAVATNVNISQFPGDPTTLEQPGGPEVRHTQFLLYNNSPSPESIFDGAGGIRVYDTADFAGYTLAEQEFQNLQTLLAQRPDLAQHMVVNEDGTGSTLPFLPVFPAAQVIRARANYVTTPSLQGISYVTVYRQDVSPFISSEFLYTFQGISADGSRYVSAIFKLNTALFPAEIPPDFDFETFNAQFNQYLTDSIATLNNATPEDFTPSLATLDSIIQSFTLAGGEVVQPPTTPVPAATILPTATVGDATMGGLAGVTWTLVSYGDPANPQPVVGTTPITLIFSDTGVGGNAGCNTFGGSFQFDRNSLTISQVVSTLMACTDQAVMEQETAFLNALSSASTFQINGSQLQINYADGVLNFTAS
jgi:heat shock protein HslJ